MKTFKCVGVQTFEKDNKKGKTIYYIESFDDYEKNCIGEKVGKIFTYKDVQVPKVGEQFKAFYSVGFDFRTQSNVPVLEEIQVIPFK